MQIFTLNLEDQITQETDFFTVNVDDAEKIYLKCYGLGIANGDFPTIDSEAYLGGAWAMAKTAVFDIAKPTIEVITGIKKFPKAGDLRGRDNDDPLYKLVMNYYEKLFKSSSTYTKFLKATDSALSSGNAKKEVMKTFWSITKGFLTDEKNVELYIEILKKYATLSVAEKAILNKAFTIIFPVKAAADITENFLNLGEAVYATFATNWTTEFRINVDGTVSGSNIPTDGLVAYYPFNGNANDESGNGNHGELLDGISLTADRNGKTNSAYNFGGYYNTSAIKVTNSASLQFTGQFTVSAWYNLKGLDGMDGWGNYSENAHHCILSKDGDRGGFHIHSRGISINNSSDNSTEFGANIDEAPSIGVWRHVATVVTPQTVEFFIDGQSVAKNTYDTVNITVSNERDLYIGRFFAGGWAPSGWFPFNGDIDDVRVYNRALTASEIQTLFNE